jgi:hypothetical protein
VYFAAADHGMVQDECFGNLGTFRFIVFLV